MTLLHDNGVTVEEVNFRLSNMQRRLNSAAASSGQSNGFDRVERDGVTYLAHDVVAQREGVYTYPDPNGGTRKEFVPAEELTGAIEGVERVPIVVSHPEAPDENAAMTTDPRANFSKVGIWEDLRETRDGDGIAGRTLIRENEIGQHDGRLESYIETVRRHGVGEVSTGYNIQRAEPDGGRYNGSYYDYVQRGIGLDHLALLPDEMGDCSVEDGCGLGRANDREQQSIRVNHQMFDGETDDGGDGSNPPEDSGSDGGSGSRRTDHPDDGGLTDAERVDQLVEQYNFTRENIAPLEGSTCLVRIHEAVVEDEGLQPDNMGNEGNEGDGDGGDDGIDLPDDIEEQIDQRVEQAKEEVREDVEEDVLDKFEDRLDDIDGSVSMDGEEVEIDDIVEQAAQQAAEQADEVRANERNIEKVAQSDEYPMNRDQLERMNKEVVADLAEEIDEADDDSDTRANFAGTPTGGSFDESEFTGDDDNGSDIPAAGGGLTGSSGGDD